MTFVQAVVALRALFDSADEHGHDAVRDIRRVFTQLIHENNALRRNNERLARRLKDAEDMNDTLREQFQAAEASNRNAQTMAAHWRLKAEGGNYDETKEDGS